MPVEHPVIKATPLFINPSQMRLIDLREACIRSPMAARPDAWPCSGSPRNQIQLDDQGQVVREGIAIEGVDPAEGEMVAEGQMGESLGRLPGREGGGGRCLGDDGFVNQSQFRVLFDIEIPGQNGGYVLLADMLDDVLDLGRPDRLVQAEVGDKQPAGPVIQYQARLAEKARLARAG